MEVGAVTVTLRRVIPRRSAAVAINAGLAVHQRECDGQLDRATCVITSQIQGAHTLTIGGTNTYAGLNGTYTGTARTETSLKDALNAAFSASSTLQKAGLQATVDGSHHFTVASNNGTAFRVNTSTTGAPADIGFGHAGATFGGLTVNNSRRERARCQRRYQHTGHQLPP